MVLIRNGGWRVWNGAVHKLRLQLSGFPLTWKTWKSQGNQVNLEKSGKFRIFLQKSGKYQAALDERRRETCLATKEAENRKNKLKMIKSLDAKKLKLSLEASNSVEAIQNEIAALKQSF